MRTRFLGFFTAPLTLATLATTFSSAPAHAVDAFFCNDTFSAGDNVSFQTGFAAGEEAAVKIVPDASAFPVVLVTVFLFYGKDDNQNAVTESINVYADDDATGLPGALLASSPAPLVDSLDQINEVALESPILVPAGNFWVALHLSSGDGTGSAGPASDDGPLRAGRNAILANGIDWVDNSGVGVNGNWIIRVEGDADVAQDDAACRLSSGGEGEGAGGEGAGPGEGEGEGGGEGAGGLTVTTVNPSSTPEGVDVRVTVLGTGFSDGIAVRVGSVTCTDVEVQSDGALLATVPAATLAVGTYDVIAQQGGDTFVFPSGFTVTAGGCACSSTSTTALFGSGVLVLFVVGARVRRRVRLGERARRPFATE